MRYFVRDSTLFVRGKFRGISTGACGGIADVRTVINHKVESEYDGNVGRTIAEFDRYGYGSDKFCLFTAVPMRYLCVVSYGYITVFATAGIGKSEVKLDEYGVPEMPSDPAGAHTINIIVHSREKMTDAALAGALITITEAKADAMREYGYKYPGTATDAAVVVCDCGEDAEKSDTPHEYAGPVTDIGRRIYYCVKKGIAESLMRFDGAVSINEDRTPAYFVVSTLKGFNTILFKKHCEYYPCHFKGQACDLCYCPYYPCRDEALGGWYDSSSSGRVWTCSTCLLNHHPEVVKKFLENPDIELAELKAFAEKSGLNVRKE